MARPDPGACHLDERRAHRIDPSHRHRTAPDGEVVGGQLSSTLKVPLRRVAAALTCQPPRKTELGAGQLIGCRRYRLKLPDLLRFDGAHAVTDPGAERGELGVWVDAVDAGEGVGRVDGIVGPDDASLLVDPEHGRDVDDVVEVRDGEVSVDQAGMSRRCRLDPGARVLGVLVESDADDGEAEGSELCVNLLPDRQVVAAASPGGVDDEQDLLAGVIGE